MPFGDTLVLHVPAAAEPDLEMILARFQVWRGVIAEIENLMCEPITAGIGNDVEAARFVVSQEWLEVFVAELAAVEINLEETESGHIQLRFGQFIRADCEAARDYRRSGGLARRDPAGIMQGRLKIDLFSNGDQSSRVLD